ncbi:helix-turn-helix transcriptional regulator [Gracilibacillus sp. YIM 98692]|uniref:helix-turn-helix domain-containing protein n=1 Tax=Gracilibacillus sp. YIM 98692 TaxID=2663532 RepID=UPI0013D8864C|nr:helix-turn-helix transcriptional regulator [Gracilibacillus sp. YIM 98692]
MKREWLIQARKSKKLTQEQVAAQSFIDRGYYSQIENGKRNPGPSVALNIAKILEFDPMLFFPYKNTDTSNNPENKQAQHSIIDFYKNISKGNILYLYNDKSNYLNNAVHFLLTRLEIDQYCFFIDHHQNIQSILLELENILPKSKIKQNIIFMDSKIMYDNTPINTINFFQSLQLPLTNDSSICIWSSEEKYFHDDWLSLLKKYFQSVNTEYSSIQTLLVRSYDAFSISAALHIKIMRDYQYLMTDYEIVESPLYSASDKFMLPSLFLQDNS